jgi:hypothetical protein
MLNTTTSQFLHSSASSNTKSEEVKTKSEAQVEIQVLSLSLSYFIYGTYYYEYSTHEWFYLWKN